MLDKKRTAILSVRIPRELKSYLATRAHKERKSLSDIINEVLNNEYENQNRGE